MARGRGRGRDRRIFGGAALALAVLVGVDLAHAEGSEPMERVEVLDLRVEFRVETLFPVDGTFGPVEGELAMAPEGGAMSGELRVDAATADTGYALRDAVIRGEVLEAPRYPVIAFRPQSWRVRGRTDSQLSATLSGTLALHGVERPVTVELEARLGPADVADVRCGLAIEFEAWGIESPGNAYLPVEPRVGIVIQGRVRLRPPRP